ncbi:MAG: sensor histidine kinase [Pseudobdellovibrionaceae bacterium]
MLYDFLEKFQTEILAISADKTKILAGKLENSEQLKQGLPLFYEQLIKVLKQKMENKPPEEMLSTAALHGKEFLKLGYTLSHVVHAYGAMCQSITELASMKNAKITANEFNILNGCLDVAIAAAVSEHQFRSNEARELREVKHLGFLAHELRNALSSATIAHEMIRAGLVGVGGSTSSVLGANLERMRYLIDRSLSEVRLRADVDLFIEKFRLSDLFDQITITEKVYAEKKKITISAEVDRKIEMEADRQLLISIVANLIQNSIKYSLQNKNIWLKGTLQNDEVLIEIEDQAGGLNPEKIDALFEPFVRDNDSQAGLGLGLCIVKRAVHLSKGRIEVKNEIGIGCKFMIYLPVKLVADPLNKTSVKGIESVQPNFSKKV